MPFDFMIDRSKHSLPTQRHPWPCPNSSGQNMALKSYSCGCGCRFQVARGEDTTKCLTCRIVDDLKAGRVQPPAAIRRPRESPAL